MNNRFVEGYVGRYKAMIPVQALTEAVNQVEIDHLTEEQAKAWREKAIKDIESLTPEQVVEAAPKLKLGGIGKSPRPIIIYPETEAKSEVHERVSRVLALMASGVEMSRMNAIVKLSWYWVKEEKDDTGSR